MSRGPIHLVDLVDGPPPDDVPHAAESAPPTGAVARAPTVAPPPPKWRRCRDDVDTILARAEERWVSLRLAGDEIATIRPGGIVLLVGGTGRGKTSLAATMLLEHARDHGPALAMSLELPADEWTARAVGTRCDESWAGVLCGEVPRDRMIEVLPERLARIDRDAASLTALETAIVDLRREYAGEPILVGVDYVQLVGADSDDDIRPRVGRTMRQLDRVARDHRVVLVALAQGSRASARGLSSGERVGADTTDAGAESADLERWATVTLAIGKLAPDADDGSCAVEISLGKGRMTGGDRVFPARYNGRTGLWRLAGDARPAAEIRAERTATDDASKIDAAAILIAKGAADSERPLTKEELCTYAVGFAAKVARAALGVLLGRGDIVIVARKRPRSSSWLLWTREGALAASIPIVTDREAP